MDLEAGAFTDTGATFKDFITSPGDVIYSIVNTILSPFLKALGGIAHTFTKWGNESFSDSVKAAVELLKMSPENWNADGWKVMQTVNTSFIALGATLVIIFWCIKLCSDNLDIRQTMRPETMVKELTVLIVAEWFVCNSFSLFSTFFGFVSYLTNGVDVNTNALTISMPSGIESLLTENVELVNILAAFIISPFYLLIMTFLGVQVLYFAYVRFFKVMVIAPYASLVTSTVAGPNSISHSTVAFFKYALSTVLEAVTMILIIRLSVALFSSGLVGFEAASSSITDIDALFKWYRNEIILGFVMVGAIKEASVITQRALG